jgi:hypothetical protein
MSLESAGAVNLEGSLGLLENICQLSDEFEGIPVAFREMMQRIH